MSDNIVDYFSEITRCKDCLSALPVCEGVLQCKKKPVFTDGKPIFDGFGIVRFDDRCDNGSWLMTLPSGGKAYFDIKYWVIAGNPWWQEGRVLPRMGWPRMTTQAEVEDVSSHVNTKEGKENV